MSHPAFDAAWARAQAPAPSTATRAFDAAWDAPSPAPAAPSKAPLLRRVENAALGIVEHPIKTAEAMVTAPIQSVRTAMAPGSAQDVAALNTLGTTGKGGPMGVLPFTKADIVTPEQRKAALVQVGVNAVAPALARIPVVGPTVTGLAAGAAYDPQDPLVGAILGSGLGTAVHVAPKIAGAATEAVSPDIGKAVERAAADVAKEAGAAPKPSTEIPSAGPAFESAWRAAQEAEPQVTAAENAAKAAQARADAEAKATAEFQQFMGSRTKEGIERGIVRRPAPPPAEVVAPKEPPPPAEPPAAAPARAAEPLPSYPEGFAMGGPESRIPKVTVPKGPRGVEAPSTFVGPELANALGAAQGAEPSLMPRGTPKGVGASELVNPNAFRPAIEAHPDLFDREMARVSAQGLDKGYVPFSEQQKVAHAFADAVGVDRLQLDRRAFARLSGAEVVGLKDVLTANIDQLEVQSRIANDPTVSAADRQLAQEAITKIQRNNDVLLSGIVHGTSELGRGFGFLRQISARSLDPDVWVVQAQRLAGNVPLSDDVILTIRKMAREAAEACAR